VPQWLKGILGRGGIGRRVAAVEGGLYSIPGDKDGYRVIKVLQTAPGQVHVRLYANRFTDRPRTLEIGSLMLGRIDDPRGFGMGHLPFSDRTFRSWNPVLVVRTDVSSEELEGLAEWRSAKGGLV